MEKMDGWLMRNTKSRFSVLYKDTAQTRQKQTLACESKLGPKLIRMSFQIREEPKKDHYVDWHEKSLCLCLGGLELNMKTDCDDLLLGKAAILSLVSTRQKRAGYSPGSWPVKAEEAEIGPKLRGH